MYWNSNISINSGLIKTIIPSAGSHIVTSSVDLEFKFVNPILVLWSNNKIESVRESKSVASPYDYRVGYHGALHVTDAQAYAIPTN